MVSDGSLALWHYNARRRGLQDVYIDWIAQGGFLCQMFSQEQGVPELKGSIAQIVQERCCVFHSSSQTVLFQKDQCIARRRTRPRCAHCFWHGFWVAKFSCSLREGQHLGRAQRQEENKATHLPKAGCSRQRLPCLPIVVFVKQPSVDKNAAASRTHWRVYGWGIFTVST